MVRFEGGLWTRIANISTILHSRPVKWWDCKAGRWWGHKTSPLRLHMVETPNSLKRDL